MKFNHNLILVLILLLSLVIRLISFNQSLWLDEAIQAWSATLPLQTLLKDYIPGDFNPPLIHLILWFWTRLFGTSEIALRLPSVFAGVATVYISYFFAKKILPKKQHFLFNLFIVFAPLLVYYSQEARMYAFSTLFVTWSMYEFWLITNSKNKNIFRYFLANSLMFFSHYLAWFIFPTQVLILLVLTKNKKEFISKFKFILIPLLSIILILPFLIPQLKVGSSAQQDLSVWKNLSSFSLRQLVLIPAKILVGRLPLGFNLTTILFVAIPLLTFAFLILKHFNFRKAPYFPIADRKFTFLFIWLIFPVFIGIILSFWLNIFTYFRFLFIAPAFYLLLLYSLNKLSSKFQPYYIYSFLTITIISTLVYLINPTHHREDWRFLVNYVHQKQAYFSQDVLILSAVDRPFWYYDQNKSNLFDYAEFEKDLRFKKYIWLVKYAQPIFEPDNNTEEKMQAYGFLPIEEKHFRGDLILKLMYNPVAFTAYVEK